MGNTDNMSSSGAIFSEDRLWRYVLWRRWTYGNHVVFIGLNPSTATEYENDPTITRCARYAYNWGYSGIIMLNIFGYRSTDPKGLLDIADPIGPDNDIYINKEVRSSKLVIAAWGNNGKLNNRSDQVREMLKGCMLKCLGVTKENEPKHPLYLKNDIKPVRYIY